jgi:hypothetical protein
MRKFGGRRIIRILTYLYAAISGAGDNAPRAVYFDSEMSHQSALKRARAWLARCQSLRECGGAVATVAALAERSGHGR